MSRAVRTMKRSGVFLTACVLAACASGPDYKRPDMVLPESWPAKQAGQNDQDEKAAVKTSSASEQWWHLYADTTLDQLEDEALAHNSDIQVAAARVLEMQAQAGITGADQYPTVSAHVLQSRTENTLAGAFPRPATLPRTQNLSHASLDASYELDLWGKLRRASEAARADLLSAESARDTVRLTLTTQVAQQYFSLVSLDAQEVALQRLLASRQERIGLNRKQLEVGVISEYDLHQAEADVAAVQSQLSSLDLARNKQETALTLLLGRSPRDVMSSSVQRGSPLLPATTVPDGLPSDLLLRRPDLKDAEQRLVSLNARIGVARAQYFPSISLTSYVGGESVAFSDLFTGPARIFQFAANVTQPIFNAGRLGYLVDAAEARRDQALIQYKQAVANAFGDVRNALAAQDSARQVLSYETARSEALESAYKQAELRYKAGIASRLELLDVERNYLQAQLNRLDAERAQRSAVADLFKALGGGWQKQDVAKAP
ncbi:efflux transporter outer membrane subunit [Sideroxydans lithotrophicus]|uniref:RND efflux system, outer membrane lipoprotein, NodT family n=1 Tax=Sideroxydans lithotrophicus (strain ES-1) TaxID=580332 RepID=D5CTR6_SIDLE|nr:efflux transporter outer membrane subunit [Sideroxydans lithotrophicus]ADE12228.1 RND efflux system, outer membrane lipoprotein, NodT family [Sideroxydans lithotrophicus ES-1]